MRKKKEEKKKVMLCGQLICPVTVGKPAVFAAGGEPLPYLPCCGAA